VGLNWHFPVIGPNDAGENGFDGGVAGREGMLGGNTNSPCVCSLTVLEEDGESALAGKMLVVSAIVVGPSEGESEVAASEEVAVVESTPSPEGGDAEASLQ